MSLLSHGLYLPAVVVARSLLEHFASFYGFVEELKDIVRSGDYESAYGLAENTAMRHTLKGLPSEALAPKVAKLILRLENRMPNAKSDYDFLCQYGHPSAFSIWLLYGSDGHVQENYWNFQPGGWDPEQSYKCASVVLGQLRHISADINNLDMCAAELSEKAPRG